VGIPLVLVCPPSEYVTGVRVRVDQQRESNLVPGLKYSTRRVNYIDSWEIPLESAYVILCLEILAS